MPAREHLPRRRQNLEHRRNPQECETLKAQPPRLCGLGCVGAGVSPVQKSPPAILSHEGHPERTLSESEGESRDLHFCGTAGVGCADDSTSDTEPTAVQTNPAR